MLRSTFATAANRASRWTLRRAASSSAESVQESQSTGKAPVERPRHTNHDQSGIRGFIDAYGGAGAMKVGRSWRASELRLKSYEDLHKLWFILLRERNTLLTEKAWCKTNFRHWKGGKEKLWKLKKSMARIQCVVGERKRAYKAKMALLPKAEPAQEAGEDKIEGNTDSSTIQQPTGIADLRDPPAGILTPSNPVSSGFKATEGGSTTQETSKILADTPSSNEDNAGAPLPENTYSTPAIPKEEEPVAKAKPSSSDLSRPK